LSDSIAQFVEEATSEPYTENHKPSPSVEPEDVEQSMIMLHNRIVEATISLAHMKHKMKRLMKRRERNREIVEL